MLFALLGLTLLATNPVLATDDAAMAVANRTADAIDAAASLSFACEQTTVRADGTTVVTLRGRGRVSGATAERGPLIWVEGEGFDGEASSPFLLWSDGEEVRIHDGRTRTVWTTRMHRCGIPMMETHGRGAASPLTASSTYRNLATYGPELREPTRRGDVDCQVIGMALPNGTEYRLVVGTDDGLPREISKPAGEDTAVTAWSELAVGASPATIPPAPTVPEAWEEREFTLGGPVVGQAAPTFDLVDATGVHYTPESLRGKVVLLDFWATWCAPCVASMPGLQRISEEFGDRDVLVLGARWSDRGDPAPLLERLGVRYPIVDGSRIGEVYGVENSGIPALFVLDRDGNVADFFLGYQGKVTEVRLRRAVESLAD